MVKTVVLSNKQKFLTYWERGYRNAARIAKLVRMNKRTAQRYAKKMLEEGTLDRKIGSGGHNKIINQVERRVIAHVKDSKKPYTCNSLAGTVRVSRETVRRVLKKIGIHIPELGNTILHVN